jgi:hypothetical protein
MRAVDSEINTVRIPSRFAAIKLSRYISDAGFTFRNYLLYGGDPVLAAKYETARQAAWANVFAQYDILKQLDTEDEELIAQLNSATCATVRSKFKSILSPTWPEAEKAKKTKLWSA